MGYIVIVIIVFLKNLCYKLTSTSLIIVLYLATIITLLIIINLTVLLWR